MLLTTGCSIVYGAELDEDDWFSEKHWEETFSHKLAEKLDIGYTCLAKCGNSNHKIFRDLIQWFNGRIASSVTNQGTTPDNCTHMVVIWSQWFRNEFFSDKLDNTPSAWSDHDELHLGFVQGHHNCSNIKDFVHWQEWLAQEQSYRDVYYRGHKQIADLITYMQTIQKLCQLHNIKLVQGEMSNSFWLRICELCSVNESKIHKVYKTSVSGMLKTLDKTSKVGFKHYTPIMSKEFLGENNEKKLKFGHPNAKVHAEYAEYLYTIFQEQFPEGEKK